MWICLYVAEAVREREALVARDKAALINAEAKLAVLEARLPFPHSCAVQGADRLRELRPRGGRSPWRALNRQIGGQLVIAAVCPETNIDPRGSAAACRHAESRLARFEGAT